MIVPMIAVALLAGGLTLYERANPWYFDAETSGAFFGLIGLLQIGFALSGLFLGSRSVTLSGRTVSYVSWFTRRRFDAASFKSVRMDTPSNNPFSRYVILETESGDQLRLNTILWNRRALSMLIGVLNTMSPEMVIDRGAVPFVTARG
jgi:hypothetical protein